MERATTNRTKTFDFWDWYFANEGIITAVFILLIWPILMAVAILSKIELLIMVTMPTIAVAFVRFRMH